MYFCFFVRKNRNAWIAMLAAGVPAAVSSQLYISVFAFPLVKIAIRGQLCQHIGKLFLVDQGALGRFDPPIP